jgi:hypothetical protein
MPLTKVKPGRERTASGRRSVRYRNAAGKFFDAEVVARGTASNEQQTLSATGATAGSVTLAWTSPAPFSVVGGQSASVNFNASAADVRTALEGTTSVDPGDVTVTGGPLNTTPIVVEFTGRFGGTDVGLITKTGTLTTQDLVITQTRAAVVGGLRLKLTSFLNKTYVDDVPKATSLTSTNAYYASYGPDPSEY